MIFQSSDVRLYSSEAGQMYSVMFACQPNLANKFMKGLKRFFLTLKQRDFLDTNGRSMFYCLLLKTLNYISNLEESDVLRLLSTTVD